MSEILKKLGALQIALKAPKGQYNKFGGYNYRSCEDILEAVKPILKAQGCSLTISDSLENIGSRYYIKATATLYDMESGETVTNSAYAREEESKKGMDGSQITGTASSYARKYALNGLFLIDDTKDADTNEFKDQQNNAEESKEAIKCPRCGKIVKKMKRQDGTWAMPEDILKGCGGVCYSCYQEGKKQ
mgnify:CR=1 FL=1